MTRFIYNDGGRAAAGYKGDAGDCVVRAIAIATEQPYQKIYDELADAILDYTIDNNDDKSRAIKRRGTTTPRDGTYRAIYDLYLKDRGWRWVPVMKFGTGCTMHLKKEELPPGRIIARCSRHVVACIDGVIHDTHNSSRGGTRCVYGYYTK